MKELSDTLKSRIQLIIGVSILISLLLAISPRLVSGMEGFDQRSRHFIGSVIPNLANDLRLVKRITVNPPAPVGPGIYDDSNINWTYTGTWTTASNLTGPYNGTLKYTTALNAIASIQIEGSSFRLRYTKNQFRGVLAIYVDGAKIADVNAYSAALSWQSMYQMTGLTNSVHTIEIRHGGGPTGSIIDIDSIEVYLPPAPVGTGTYDDTNSNWTYTGLWNNAIGLTGPHNGTLRFTSDKAATASIQINGTAFRLRYTKNQFRGLIGVYVDGTKVAEINAYSQTLGWQSVYQRSGLATGIHTVEIRHDGGAVDSIIDIDSLEVYAPATPTPLGLGTYDDTHNNWLLSGTWSHTSSQTGPYAGTLSHTPDQNAKASIQINGTSFRLFYTKSSNRGILSIYVDGTKIADVNSNETNVTWQSYFEKSGLTSGVHTIEIRHGGGSSGSIIDFDALEVYEPPAPVGVGIYDDTNYNWIYTGAWNNASGLTGPHNGTLKYSSDINAKAYIRFNGSAFRLRYTTNQFRGILAIYVDSLKVGEINANSKTLGWQAVFQRTGLTNAVHVIQISHGGGGADSIIDIDALEVFVPQPVSPLGVGVYDDTHPNWTYKGYWSTARNLTGPYAGTIAASDDLSASASIQIIGTAFRLRFTKNTYRGILGVYVDGAKVADVNTSSTNLEWQAIHNQTGLTIGTHTIEVRHGGPPGRLIEFDAIEIFVPPTPVGTGVYDDTNANWTYSGNWNNAAALSGPLNGTLKHTTDTAATASIQIDGTAFRLRYTKNQFRGTLSIYVDGIKISDINANSPSLVWQAVYQKTGLGNGAHTVEIRHGGGATGSIIDVDAIEVYVPTLPTPLGIGIYDDNDPNWTYAGNWTNTGGLTGAFGGTLAYTNDLSATASIQINGTAFRLRYSKNSNRGIISVYIDGVKEADINANFATLGWQAIYQKTGLTGGVHTIEIRHGGGGTGSVIDIDAVEVYLPPQPLSAGLYDDTDPNWSYTGMWNSASNLTGPYNGTLRHTTDLSATTSIQINGTSFRIRYTRNQFRGTLSVYIDGVKAADVNAYSATLSWQTVYQRSGLTNGVHTIEIRHGGGATGSIIDIDSIEVYEPPAPVGVGLYDDTNANWTYSGNWTSATNQTGSYNSTLRYSSDLTATASIQINGTAFRLRYTKNTNRGMLGIYVDGTKVADVSATNASLAWQGIYQRSGLTSGIHTIEIRHSGGLTGSVIDVDALEVYVPVSSTPLSVGTYDDTNLSWTYSGTWTHTGNLSGPYSGSLAYSVDPGASASIQINGSSFRLRFTRNPFRGVLGIYVDGIKVADINAYSTTLGWQAIHDQGGLSLGVHTIEIRHGGGAAGSIIDVDAIEVYNDLGEKVYLATLRPEGAALSSASGYSTIRLSADEQTATVRFSYSNLTTPETSAHIHGPADPGQNGQILFDLDTAPRERDGSMVWTIGPIGATSGAQIISALKTGRLYLNIHSARYPAGEIRGHFGRIEGTQTFTPPPGPPASWTLPTGTPTARDAARLLTQATFGPRATDITTVQQRGLAQWVNDQLALPVSTPTHLSYLDTTTAGKTNIYQEEMMESFWKQAVTAPDQLRQRLVFALSQLFVVSFRSNLESEPFALAGYLDMLNRNAFGNFRQLLEEVTLSPAMGRYLDHLQNDKEDPQTGRNPNENFAREILQLFSIGLYRLHPDGSLKLDTTGLPMPTYSQETVSGFAHVFTGWSYGWFSKTEQNWYWPSIWRNGTAFWRVPMQSWSNHHSTLEKRLLDGVVIPVGQTPERDLQLALDNIFNHPNTGPFIARQLIQRLVTSHPSPGYVYRVAQKFNDNGQGVRGDMKAVIRAILLDYEARSLDQLANQGYGKLREPVLRFAHLLRAFNYTCPCGTYPIYWMDSPEWAIGQNPLRSPTVFNFFEPTYSQPGRLAAAGLNSPEFQITTETSVIGISDFFHYVVREGFNWEVGKPLTPDYTAVAALAGSPTQLIDHLDLVLTAGGMSSSLKNKLVTEIGRLPSNDPVRRTTMAIHLILTSPDYVIQK